MPGTLIWHGHSCFQLLAGAANILIDPFFEDDPSRPNRWEEIEKPNLVLITHDHWDHTCRIEEFAAMGSMVGCVTVTGAALEARGVPKDRLIGAKGFNIGGSVEFQGVRITMIQACHSTNSGVAVGYILELPGGFTLYHSGDTGIFSEMELYGRFHDIDLSLLPIGGVFTMGPEQAAFACKLLRTRAIIPMHWGTFPGLEQNTLKFQSALEKFSPDTSLIHLKPGESIRLGSSLFPV